MLRSIERRISNLEASIPVPLTAERFVARANQHARRFGANVPSAIETLVKDLRDSELASLAVEFEEIVFGSVTTARDAAKREVLVAAGYPVWNSRSEHQEEGW